MTIFLAHHLWACSLTPCHPFSFRGGPSSRPVPRHSKDRKYLPHHSPTYPLRLHSAIRMYMGLYPCSQSSTIQVLRHTILFQTVKRSCLIYPVSILAQKRMPSCPNRASVTAVIPPFSNSALRFTSSVWITDFR